MIGPYLLVITKKEKVGEIEGHVIWKVTGTELHSYKKTMLHLTEKQVVRTDDLTEMLDILTLP